MQMKIVVVTGGFDPLHSGHIAYFKAAKALGHYLIVGVNSDAWLRRKKGRSFMPIDERASIIRNLSVVDEVKAFDDEYDSDNSCTQFIKDVLQNESTAKIIFANGGDRTKTNIPEMSIEDPRLTFEFGVGGKDKKNSSSWILKEWSQPITRRAWGTYKVLDTNGRWQVKELSFDKMKSLSDQRHKYRDEHWHIVEGHIVMQLEFPNGDIMRKHYKAGDSIDIMRGTWHKATNVGPSKAKVIEVWVGEKLEEADIERRD